MLLAGTLLAAVFIAADALARAINLFRLGKAIDGKGDYRCRSWKVGKGKPFVVTLLGASSMYGEGSTVEIPFVADLVETVVRQGREVTVRNLAVSGHTVADIITKQLPHMPPSNLVLVYTGTKDCCKFTSPRQFLADIHQLARGLRGQRVLWVTMGDPRLLWGFPVWLRWLFYWRARGFNRLLKQVVAAGQEEKWQIVDFFAHGTTRANKHRLSARHVVSDGIHLSNQGQALVGAMIAETFAPR